MKEIVLLLLLVSTQIYMLCVGVKIFNIKMTFAKIFGAFIILASLAIIIYSAINIITALFNL